MKSDINLIYKRKTKTYSNKMILGAVLLIAALAAGMYAGIALPSGALNVAKLHSAELDSKLSSSTQTQQQLTALSATKASLLMQKAELDAVNDIKDDVSSYLEAIEKALPASANAYNIVMLQNGISIYGTAEDDSAIATFCLRLREQNIFESVFVTVSTYLEREKIHDFQVDAVLASSLDSKTLIKEIEGKDDFMPSAAPEPEVNN